MRRLDMENPFGAPVYSKAVVSSTMDEARLLAEGGAPHGTVITAGFQEKGRGSRNRPWNAGSGNLFFTILLRYQGFGSIPPALTLRAGLAVALAVEDTAAVNAESSGTGLQGPVLVKWPNDVMIPLDGAYKKTAGILAEGNGTAVFIGVGVNVGQIDFPPELRDRAGSLALAFGSLFSETPVMVLKRILARFHEEIETPENLSSWRERLTRRLYKKGEPVRFTSGAADKLQTVEGILGGIGPSGEIIITAGSLPRESGFPGREQSFAAGELEFIL
jgi:BirA family biotin operon repressor/biotin-[acetyl-CoA-carboxylase] ligase